MVEFIYFNIANLNPSVLCFAKLLYLCPTLCDPMDCSPPGSSVHKFLKLCMTKPQPLERLPELILGWGPGHID